MFVNFNRLLVVRFSCSLLNHSCQPNCIVEFDGVRINVRTLKDLKHGDEVSIYQGNFSLLSFKF